MTNRPKRNFRLDRTVEWAPVEIAATIDDIPLIAGKQVVYTIRHGGFDIPVFAYLRPETGKVMFFGQESLVRENTILPLFYRWSWHVNLPNSSMLVLNDPSLNIHRRLGCCWSQGTADRFALEAMRDVVVTFCRMLGVHPCDAVLFGASAGGFWAMMTGIDLQSRFVAVDCPQTDMFSWHETGARDAMFESCYAGLTREDVRTRYSDRLRVIDRINRTGQAPDEIYFIENKQDVKHVRTQWLPFYDELAALPADLRPAVVKIEYDRLGDRGQTHTTMEKQETVSVLTRILEAV